LLEEWQKLTKISTFYPPERCEEETRRNGEKDGENALTIVSEW